MPGTPGEALVQLQVRYAGWGNWGAGIPVISATQPGGHANSGVRSSGLTLAFGIGAAAAIFAASDGVCH